MVLMVHHCIRAKKGAEFLIEAENRVAGLFIQNTVGFMVGVEQEQMGQLFTDQPYWQQSVRCPRGNFARGAKLWSWLLRALRSIIRS